jgi:hypothetical protein
MKTRGPVSTHDMALVGLFFRDLWGPATKPHGRVSSFKDALLALAVRIGLHPCHTLPGNCWNSHSLLLGERC